MSIIIDINDGHVEATDNGGTLWSLDTKLDEFILAEHIHKAVAELEIERQLDETDVADSVLIEKLLERIEPPTSITLDHSTPSNPRVLWVAHLPRESFAARRQRRYTKELVSILISMSGPQFVRVECEYCGRELPESPREMSLEEFLTRAQRVKEEDGDRLTATILDRCDDCLFYN